MPSSSGDFATSDFDSDSEATSSEEADVQSGGQRLQKRNVGSLAAASDMTPASASEHSNSGSLAPSRQRRHQAAPLHVNTTLWIKEEEKPLIQGTPRCVQPEVPCLVVATNSAQSGCAGGQPQSVYTRDCDGSSTNGNVCKSSNSEQNGNTVSSSEEFGPQYLGDTSGQVTESTKDDEGTEVSSTVDSGCTDEDERPSNSELPSDEVTMSSCACESRGVEEEESECSQCIKEVPPLATKRIVPPEVVIVRPEPPVGETGQEEPTTPPKKPSHPGLSSEPFIPLMKPSSKYLQPPVEPTIDIMHKGKPLPDDSDGETTSYCRLSEEEFIATLSIHDAAKKGDLHVVKLLLKRDSKKMETVDERGWTPIHLASSNGHADVVKFLALEGADLVALDPSSYTSIHLAAMSGHNNCIEVLLKMGANVDSVTSEGFTPLHLAVMNSHVECCKTLLSWGASMEKKDALGRTVQDMVEEYNLDEVATLLHQFRQRLQSIKNILHIVSAPGSQGNSIPSEKIILDVLGSVSSRDNGAQ